MSGPRAVVQDVQRSQRRAPSMREAKSAPLCPICSQWAASLDDSGSDIVKKKAMTALLPTILVGLTAFIIMVVIEAIYFVCHLWRCLFDGSALSFSWVEPLPAAGISTGVVLLVTFIATRFMSAARFMSRQSGDDLDSIDVRNTANNNSFRAHLGGHPAERYRQLYSVENVDAEKQADARELGVHSH